MADIKISDLTAATTPLGGTEVLPIVQSGVTVKVAVSNLTAGRSVSATAVAITGSTSGTATIVTPAVAGTPTITLPIVTGTLATLAGTETLTNKTLTGAVMNGTVGATTPAAGAFTTGTFSSTLDVTGAATLTTLRATTGGSVHPIQYDGSATNRAIIQSDNGTIILFDIAGSITPTLPLISGLTLPFQITVALAAGAGGTIVLTRSGTNNISFNAVSQATATTIVHGSTLTLAANSSTGRWITLGINGTWT